MYTSVCVSVSVDVSTCIGMHLDGVKEVIKTSVEWRFVRIMIRRQENKYLKQQRF